MQITDEMKNLESEFNEFEKDLVRCQHEYKIMVEDQIKTQELIEK